MLHTLLGMFHFAAAATFTRRHFKTDFREGEAPAEPRISVVSARREPRPPGFETASREAEEKQRAEGFRLRKQAFAELAKIEAAETETGEPKATEPEAEDAETEGEVRQ